jgi:hypothetical protein
MRLARPVYEALPLTYLAIGGFAMLVSYIDVPGACASVTFAIGLVAAVAALTVHLRRRDDRARRREYPGDAVDWSGPTRP